VHTHIHTHTHTHTHTNLNLQAFILPIKHKVFLKRNLLLEYFLTKLLILTADEALIAAVRGEREEKQLSPIFVKSAFRNLSLLQSLCVPGDQGFQIPRQPAHKGVKIVNPTHRPPLPPGNIPGTPFC
jgi:hypothetical protein